MGAGFFLDPEGLLKAEVNRDVVGYCYAKVRKEASEKGRFCAVGHLERMVGSCSLICIVPSWRRKGIGSYSSKMRNRSCGPGKPDL